ncbi:MAG TPA: hypothetical protein VLN08_08565 [Vicinamibacterales bacterium]|nr:hypothetical protein [Vicinamibacterales bacterium]
MDFLRIIRSVEELLYEVITWIIFYPRTMWRVVVHPSVTMGYSDTEQTDSVEEQYLDALSPPLFLMLTILIAHGIGLALGVARVEARTEAGEALLGTQQNLLILRSILFSVFPLEAAAAFVRRQRLMLDRRTLRGPFFSQCYVTAPFALVISTAFALAGRASIGGSAGAAALAVAGTLWYLSVQTTWLSRRLKVGTAAAGRMATWTFLKAAFYFAALGTVVVLLNS